MTTWNFSAGPATLPREVMQQAQAELLDWKGLGVSVMEISHRSPEFEALAEETKQDLRDLLNLPDEFEILFTTGGAQAQFAFVPMNFLNPEDQADYLITGQWSEKAAQEALRFANIHVVANASVSNFTQMPAPETWQQNSASQYFHYVSNETVNGLQICELPATNKPLVVDMSSDFLSRPLCFDNVALIYAGAQKNVGPAGLTVLLVRRDWLDRCKQRVPKIYNYAVLSQFDSMPNTPPTFFWYLTGLVFKWLKQQGGLTAMQERSQRKAKLIYDVIDQSQLYVNNIDLGYRSKMNVVFDFKDESLLPKFLTEAKARGLIGLKGHKIRGGVRASIYNAMPEEGVNCLIKFMKEFEYAH